MKAPSVASGRRRSRDADRPTLELALQLLDVRIETSRLRADAEGRPVDRKAELDRAKRVDAMAGGKVDGVTERLEVMRGVVKRLRRRSLVSVAGVADAMAAAGHPLDRRTIYRRLDYMAVINEANGVEGIPMPDDPEWPSIVRMDHLALEKALKKARRERRRARLALEEAKRKVVAPDVDRLRREMSEARTAHRAATRCRRPAGPPAGSPRKPARSKPEAVRPAAG
ncbi:hypothetical protein [Sphingomonas sp.]|jgi:hypothetical protein|uniref:hypothetical protein n=1 Tax=Sphingomonas sp. TaxID=28214 RepID=UPI002E307ADE|nr:hypothetical protein [Sphingomonas sp.]HEX4694451.1 hypothetical protein [Sphingomonas sp.]